ncbi:Cysteine-rich with EGF-like domain protein 2 [Hypsibius exemplaris]|uniref:Cysteine-rich with EGF-like domain protein 2 n=1 Tax=Hypsibius exemplaris TaxID=2072580 RepID=A0A1W0X9M5_HYPEX|nr:Cysteine-rich with EGF-like domain protein 2 [Hypsibius exemplaris]
MPVADIIPMVTIIDRKWLNFGLFCSLLLTTSGLAADPKLECQACKDFVESFWQGHGNTAKSNFGGGNTDWEETRLGSYATSETRLVEILEHACSSGSAKDQCHQFAEKHEDQIENWYFHRQKSDPDFEGWLCVKNAKVCCPKNTFGKLCDHCPIGDSDFPCSGRGECDGNGTTSGTGKCRCQKGYTGLTCDSCGNGFEEVERDSVLLLCEDVNECELDPHTCNDREYCFNTQGAYTCNKCHVACKGCTGAGTARCKACAEGYVLSNGTCTDEDLVEEEDDADGGTEPAGESVIPDLSSPIPGTSSDTDPSIALPDHAHFEL